MSRYAASRRITTDLKQNTFNLDHDFGEAGVALHGCTVKIDVSPTTGSENSNHPLSLRAVRCNACDCCDNGNDQTP
jgi:hypothetical protein